MTRQSTQQQQLQSGTSELGIKGLAASVRDAGGADGVASPGHADDHGPQRDASQEIRAGYATGPESEKSVKGQITREAEGWAYARQERGPGVRCSLNACRLRALSTMSLLILVSAYLFVTWFTSSMRMDVCTNAHYMEPAASRLLPPTAVF